MATEYQFGSREEANSFRDEHGEHTTDRLDRRHKTVEVKDDAPEHVHEAAFAAAEEGRAEREVTRGQEQLTEREREQIDFSEGRASVPHAQSVKALFVASGAGSNWLDHYDTSLSVDEHRDIAQRIGGGGQTLEQAERSGQGRHGGGDIRERDPDDPDVVEGRAGQVARFQGQRCDHARGECELGDPDACEFLHEACGYSDDEIRELMDGEDELTGRELGALKRSWGGYLGAVAAMDELVTELEEEHRNAHQAFQTINRIREENGQDPLVPLNLEELEGELRAGENLGELIQHVTDQTRDTDQGVEIDNPAIYAAENDPFRPLPEEERGIRAEELIGTGLDPEELPDVKGTSSGMMVPESTEEIEERIDRDVRRRKKQARRMGANPARLAADEEAEMAFVQAEADRAAERAREQKERELTADGGQASPLVDDRPQQAKLGTEDPTQHRESKLAEETASEFGVDDRSDPSRGPASNDPSGGEQAELGGGESSGGITAEAAIGQERPHQVGAFELFETDAKYARWEADGKIGTAPANIPWDEIERTVAEIRTGRGVFWYFRVCYHLEGGAKECTRKAESRNESDALAEAVAWMETNS